VVAGSLRTAPSQLRRFKQRTGSRNINCRLFCSRDDLAVPPIRVQLGRCSLAELDTGGVLPPTGSGHRSDFMQSLRIGSDQPKCFEISFENIRVGPAHVWLDVWLVCVSEIGNAA